MDPFGLSRISHPPDDNGRPLMSMADAWTNGYPGPPMRDAEEESSLLECWRILKSRKLTLLVFGIIGFGLGFLFTRAQAPLYQAVATIEIEDLNTSLPSISRSVQAPQPESAFADLQTQIQLLQSQTLLTKTMDRLSEDALRSGKLLEIPPSPVMKLFHPAPAPPQVASKLALLAVADSLIVRPLGPSRILEIRDDSADPQLAADFANRLVDEYIQQDVENRVQNNQRNDAWLERQLDEMRQKLSASEYALEDYARDKGLLFTGAVGPDESKSNVSEDRLRQIQQSLSAATTDRVHKEATYRVASGSPPDALADVLNDPSLRELQSKITDLKRQLADLKEIYTTEFAHVKRVEDQIQTLEAAFDRQRKEVLERIKNDYDEAKIRENMLLSEYQDQAKTVSQDSEKSIQYQMLSHEVDTNRQVYDSMLQRIKESRIDAALKNSNVRKVDAARRPKLPYKPRTKLDSAVGMLLGVFFGAGFVIVVDRADRSIRNPGQMVASLPVPELGVIPRGAGRNTLLARVGLGFNGDSPMIAESFRVVITSMLLANENGTAWRTLVCTSSSAAEGKTTVAANLAVALSKIGKKILLVDADLTQPSLHHVFRIANDKGLTLLLRTYPLSDEAIFANIQETRHGVSVLTAGPRVNNAANLLFAGNMPELLARLKDEFDVVLIDTPPTPQMPHARILGRMADGVILVVRAGKTTREAVSAALQRLAMDRIPVLGTILNDWNPRRSASDYYSGYYANKGRRNGRATPRAFSDAMDTGDPWNPGRG